MFDEFVTTFNGLYKNYSSLVRAQQLLAKYGYTTPDELEDEIKQLQVLMIDCQKSVIEWMQKGNSVDVVVLRKSNIFRYCFHDVQTDDRLFPELKELKSKLRDVFFVERVCIRNGIPCTGRMVNDVLSDVFDAQNKVIKFIQTNPMNLGPLTVIYHLVKEKVFH